jgi:starch-binding outer membrane protein, SusD/RagB family
MKRKYFQLIIILALLIFANSCKKFIEVDAPYTSFNGENVYTTDGTAISAVTAMFTNFGTGGPGGAISSVSFEAGLSADELTLVSGGLDELTASYKNELTASLSPNFWLFYYQQVYLANAAIEGLTNSNSLTHAVKQQLLGEAKFMRAFYYFYLVNLYGDVPLVVNTNYKTNSLMARTSASTVWQQIITDLLDAKNLLNENYVGADVVAGDAVTERLRPNKWTAAALLARAYLYTSDYQNAKDQASEVINTGALYSLSSLDNVFLKDPSVNKETIWCTQSTISGWNTIEASIFVLPATGPDAISYPVSLNKRLVYSFEANDKRRDNWMNGIEVGTDSFYYAYKYKSAIFNDPVIEYYTVFRLAEQYLIRSEASVQLGDIIGAQNDLNIIRNRAGLGNTDAATKDDLINAILDERRHELFCEWGHRWLDLKRTNTVDAVMNIETPLKGGTWQSFDKLYPIPLDELTADPNLTQTPGYN